MKKSNLFANLTRVAMNQNRSHNKEAEFLLYIIDTTITVFSNKATVMDIAWSNKSSEKARVVSLIRQWAHSFGFNKVTIYTHDGRVRSKLYVV